MESIHSGKSNHLLCHDRIGDTTNTKYETINSILVYSLAHLSLSELASLCPVSPEKKKRALIKSLVLPPAVYR